MSLKEPQRLITAAVASTALACSMLTDVSDLAVSTKPGAGADAANEDDAGSSDGGSEASSIPAVCRNGQKDPDEIDVDCGGSLCPRCRRNAQCQTARDCSSELCVGGRCSLASGPPYWTTVASLTTRRSGPAAVAVPDGPILVFGGSLDATLLATVEAYDVVANTWTARAPMPTARNRLGAVLARDGRVYAMGGRAPADNTDVVEVYTITTNTWTPAPQLDTHRIELGAAPGPDGRVFAIGGHNNFSGGLKTVITYEPGGAWSPVADMPTARWRSAAALGPDGRVYTFGGAQNTRSTIAYAPKDNSWTAVADMPNPREFMAAVTGPDRRIYVAGGAGQRADVYDPEADRWVSLPGLNTGRSLTSGAAGSDGRVYVIGGNVDGTSLDSVEAYGPAITVTPPTGAPGTKVEVRGTNFAADATVVIHLGTSDGPSLGTGKTDSTGALVAPLSFDVPQTATGPTRVVAVDNRSEFPVSARFAVQ